MESNLPSIFPNWKDKTVLIAEDEEINYLFLEELLENTKIKIIRAIDGQSALEECNKNTLDLILMDIKMPGMNGYEATQIIKEKYPDIPIVAQTAYAMAGEKEEILAAGCDDYISKPINSRRLIEIMSNFL